MSPISRGNMLPSLRFDTTKPTKLEVLLLGTDEGFNKDMAMKIDILTDYLADIREERLSINLNLIIDRESRIYVPYSSVTTHIIENADAQILYNQIIELDADIVFDGTELIDPKLAFTNKDAFFVTADRGMLNEQIESFLTGHDIAWDLDRPVWHTIWISKYVRDDTLSKQAFSYMYAGQSKGYSTEQVQFVRDISNKIQHVQFSKEMLNYYQQLRRHAYRRGDIENDYHFELVHQLNNYYFFVCSGLDVMARLLNSVYSLGYGRYQNYGLEYESFRTRLHDKRRGIEHIVGLKKYVEWMEFMKVRRNGLAHHSNLYLTPMIQEKRVKLTDEQMEARIDAQMDWDYVSATMGSERVEGLRAMIRQQIDITENYEKIVSDMMVVERTDRTTNELKQYIFFPLRAIQSDFDNFSQILGRIFSNLEKARRVR